MTQKVKHFPQPKGLRLDQKWANHCFHLAAQKGHPKAQVKAAAVTDNRAYERNFTKVLYDLTVPLDLGLIAETHAAQMESVAEAYEAIVDTHAVEDLDALLKSVRVEGNEEEKKAEESKAAKELAEDFKSKAIALRRKAKEPFIGVLAAMKECQMNTFKWRFYQREDGQERQVDLPTLEENLIAGLCHSRGISGCEKDNNRAIHYYQAALRQAKATETGYSSDFFERFNVLREKAKSNEIEAIPMENNNKSYESVANVLLCELLSDYKKIKTTNREDFFFEASKDALDDKQTELERVIPELSQSLAYYLEKSSISNKQAFLEKLNDANRNALLGRETTDGQIDFWELVSST